MDVVSVVEKLGEAGFIRPNRIMNNYYSIHCPFHNDGNERKPSFGILIHQEVRNGQMYPEGWCHCFACGYVSTLPEMVTELLKRKSITKSGYDWLVENVPGFAEDTEFEYLLPSELITQLDNAYALENIRRMTEAKEPQFVPEAELASYRCVVPYMYTRKLTDAAIELYDIGYDANWIPPGRKKAVPCITFPVRDKQKRTLFICRRSIEGKLFNYPTGVNKPLYGAEVLPDKCASVLVCESALNAITAHTYGYDAVALLGTGNALQMQQLRELGVQEFVICMDGDEAGERAAAKLKRQLRSCGLVWTIHMPAGKDVNDCSKEEFDILYENRD